MSDAGNRVAGPRMGNHYETNWVPNLTGQGVICRGLALVRDGLVWDFLSCSHPNKLFSTEKPVFLSGGSNFWNDNRIPASILRFLSEKP